MIDIIKKEYGRHLPFAIFFAITLTLWLHPNLKGADVSRYLYWTRSLFFDQDLLLINEFEIFGERLLITPTGYAVEFHNFGTAIFLLPFYGLAYLIDILINSTDEATRTGYESIYILLINYSTWVYAGATVLTLHKLARQYSSSQAALWAIIFSSLGSSYLYYIFFLPVNSHIVSVFLATLFLAVWQADRKHPCEQLWLAMGIIGGLLLMVASYNITYLILPLLTRLKNIGKNGFNQCHLKFITIYTISGFLAFIPQTLIWWLYFGHPLATPYAGQLFWLNPSIILTWFSGWHGLFVFSPIVALSIIGGYYLFKQDKTVAIGFVLIFLSFSYIISMNAAWWGGSSFGARYFISLTPILVITLSIFLDRFLKPIAYLMAGLFSLWTVLLYLQTTLGLTNLHNWYPINQLVSKQWLALQQLPRFIYKAQLPVSPPSLLTVVVGLAIIGGLIFSISPLLLRILQDKFGYNLLFILPGLLFALLLFIGYAGINSEVARKQLVTEGYYNGKQQIYTADPFDAMKNYNKLAGFYLKHGQDKQALITLQASVTGWPNQFRQLVGTDGISNLTYHPLNLNFGNVVRLAGYSLDKTGSDQLKVTLYWQRLAAEVDEVYYTFDIRDYSSNEELASHRIEEGLLNTSVVGTYPLDEIPDGLFFSDSFNLTYQPNNRFGTVGLTIDFVGETVFDRVIFGFVDLSASEFMWPVNYNFDNKIVLTGYRTNQEKQVLSLALQWQGLSTPTKDYKIFIHLVDSEGNIVAQRDADPLSGLRPTSSWQSEEEILDLYDIPIPPDISLEDTSIFLGFYLLDTAERLFVINPDGTALENFVRLKIK